MQQDTPILSPAGFRAELARVYDQHGGGEVIQAAVEHYADLWAEDVRKTVADEACALAAEAEIARLTLRVEQIGHALDAMTERAHVAEQAYDDAVERLGFTYCAYCGAQTALDAPDKSTEITEHIQRCEAHPMRAVEHQRDAAERRVVALTAAIVPGLNAPSGAHICCCRNVNAVRSGTERACWYCEVRAALAAGRART